MGPQIHDKTQKHLEMYYPEPNMAGTRTHAEPRTVKPEPKHDSS